MSYKLKNVVIFLKITICFLLSRPFGSIIQDCKISVEKSVCAPLRQFLLKGSGIIFPQEMLDLLAWKCHFLFPAFSRRKFSLIRKPDAQHYFHLYYYCCTPSPSTIIYIGRGCIQFFVPFDYEGSVAHLSQRSARSKIVLSLKTLSWVSVCSPN